MRISRVVLISAFTIAGLFALYHGLVWWRVSQAEAKCQQAIKDGQPVEASRQLRILEELCPGHPELLPLQAYFASRYAPAKASSLWASVLARYPQENRYRVPAVLAAIQARQFEQAREWVDSFSASDPEDPTSWRAALALAFARGDTERSRKFAQLLMESEDASIFDQVNFLKLDLLGADLSKSEEARRQLYTYANNTQVQEEVVRALLQEAQQKQNLSLIHQVEKKLSLSEAKNFETSFLIMEAKQNLGESPSPHAIKELWTGAEKNELSQSRLAGWVVQIGMPDFLFQLVEDLEPSRRWQFPLGLALAEAHINTDHNEEALDGLADVQWRGMAYLKSFIQARLSAPAAGTAAEQFLTMALTQASEHPGGLEHLIKTAEAWNWQRGYEVVLRHQLKTVRVDTAFYQKLMERAFQQKDVKALYVGSLRYLEQFPGHAPSVNNAAYFSFLLGTADREDISKLEAVRKAYPEQVEFTRTLLLLYLEESRLEDALKLAPLLESGDEAIHTWIRVWISKLTGAAPSPRDIQALKSHTFEFPEEEQRKQDLLKSIRQ